MPSITSTKTIQATASMAAASANVVAAKEAQAKALAALAVANTTKAAQAEAAKALAVANAAYKTANTLRTPKQFL
jgi:hypothetical protein